MLGGAFGLPRRALGTVGYGEDFLLVPTQNVNWRARAVPGTKVKIRVELRGTAKGNLPSQTTLETELPASATSKWTSLTLGGEDYKKFGEVTAWRATLWDGEQLVGEQKSFLW